MRNFRLALAAFLFAGSAANAESLRYRCEPTDNDGDAYGSVVTIHLYGKSMTFSSEYLRKFYRGKSRDGRIFDGFRLSDDPKMKLILDQNLVKGGPDGVLKIDGQVDGENTYSCKTYARELTASQIDQLTCSYYTDPDDDPVMSVAFEIRQGDVIATVSQRTGQSDESWKTIYRSKVKWTGNDKEVNITGRTNSSAKPTFELKMTSPLLDINDKKALANSALSLISKKANFANRVLGCGSL